MQIFDFFRRRKVQRAMRLSCASIIRMQFVVAQSEPKQHVSDNWVLGYLFGAATAVLDRMGVDPSEEAYKLLELGYGEIFTDEKLGTAVLDQSMTLRAQPDFMEAQQIGGNEVSQLGPDKPLPFALGTYLSEHKSREIRVKLRQRWLTRA